MIKDIGVKYTIFLTAVHSFDHAWIDIPADKPRMNYAPKRSTKIKTKRRRKRR